MVEILGPEWFPKDDDESEYLYRNFISGTYWSNWDFLCNAARSSFGHAAHQCSSILNGWRQSELGRGKRFVLLVINYNKMISGPLLSSVLLSAFAIESFVRLCCEAIAGMRSKAEQETAKELARLDKLSFPTRLPEVTQAAGIGELPKALDDSVKALIFFRNDCAHDSPIKYGVGGQVTKVARGKITAMDEGQPYLGKYPYLHHPMSLTLRHGLEAARTHDQLVEHILSGASEQFRRQFEAVYKYQPPRIVKEQKSFPISEIEHLCQSWERELLPWWNETSEDKDAYRGIIRRLMIKRAK